LDGVALAFTHGLRAFVRRRRWSALSMSRMALRIVAASFILAVPLGVVTLWTSVSALQDPSPLLAELAPGLAAHYAGPILLALHIANWTLVFVFWLIFYFTATSLRRRRLAELRESELARALQLAELRVLKTQLNPHFLFNSLNTVRSLIADDPTRAQRAVTHLANTLRYTLSAGHDELVTLAQELDIVREYLALETMRFEDRLSVEFKVAAEAGDVQIPVMLLQTVVENAIKHGIAELPAGGTIKISARLAGDAFLIEVENPRPATQASTARDGIGLRNADERLRLLFGSGASLDLDLSNPSIAAARIRIPKLK
jgi:two-component system, LytTR family, sensor histidine kinase AlgZ